ncbi:hypothetical protein KDA82_33435, partial [Streptomyces daliensis]|nr:hypothetical protein [Streptomyces daliensis]
AARHGDAAHRVAVVNPAATFPRLEGLALPVGRFLLRSAKGITSDIAKEGSWEVGYERMPTHAAYSLRDFFRVVRRELGDVSVRVREDALRVMVQRGHVVAALQDSLRHIGGRDRAEDQRGVRRRDHVVRPAVQAQQGLRH